MMRYLHKTFKTVLLSVVRLQQALCIKFGISHQGLIIFSSLLKLYSQLLSQVTQKIT